jgi:hypothetical protein
MRGPCIRLAVCGAPPRKQMLQSRKSTIIFANVDLPACVRPPLIHNSYCERGDTPFANAALQSPVAACPVEALEAPQRRGSKPSALTKPRPASLNMPPRLSVGKHFSTRAERKFSTGSLRQHRRGRGAQYKQVTKGNYPIRPHPWGDGTSQQQEVRRIVLGRSPGFETRSALQPALADLKHGSEEGGS